MDTFDFFTLIKDLPANEQKLKIATENFNAEELEDINDLLFGYKLQNQGLSVKGFVDNELDKLYKGNFDPENLIGTEIDNYIITEHLATGGHSFVYLAEKFVHNWSITCAIKVVQPQFRDLYSYDVIHREASILSRLNNPNIVRVLDAGLIFHDGMELPCFRMDLIKGNNIYDHFKGSYNSIEEKIKAIIGIANALEYTHSLETPIVHGDVKSQNILVDNGRLPKLIDFGISRNLYQKNDDDYHKTRYYSEKHSDKYTAPELKTGSYLSAKSDQYSLGIVFAEIITGIKADDFDAKNFSLVDNVYDDKSKILISGPSDYLLWIHELNGIFNRATHIDPKKRYTSMLDFSNDLNNFLLLKRVNAGSKNIFYNTFKSFWTTPLNAVFGTMGVAIIGAFISYGVFKFINLEQTTADENIKASFLKEYALISQAETKNTFRSFIHNSTKTLNDNKAASSDLWLNKTLNLAGIAYDKGLVDSAVTLYKMANSATKNQTLLATNQIKLAKSLYNSLDYTKAENIIDVLYREIEDKGLAGYSHLASAYIEVLDFDVKFISSTLDDDRQDVEVLELIYDKHWKLLSESHQAKLKYLLAKEYYYFFYGDTFNPSAGFEHQYFIENIKPMLKKAREHINEALEIAVNSKDIVKYSAFKVRILNEQQDHRRAINAGERVMEHSYKVNGKLTADVLLANFVANRFNHPDAAAKHARTLVELNSNSTDDWFYYSYMLIQAELAAGNVEQASKEVEHLIGMYENHKDNLFFKGLEGVRASLLSYLQLTGFDINDAFSNKVATALFNAFNITKVKFPDYIYDYELMLFDFIDRAYNEHDTSGITALLNARELDDVSINHEINQFALDAANISMALGNNETAYRLAKIAQENMVWSKVENERSTIKMINYLQLAEIFKINNDYEAYNITMKEAEVIYRYHYATLKNTPFAQAFKSSNIINI